ncbi:integrase core domain-containing protein, partial [Nitrobacter sp.]|uniref:integrase core domain-containing protein n=1 Tax=Nitrobacter sp. TaxID=29420 RepID=UPI0032205E60
LVRRLACHGSILSGVGASGKPGAVQCVFLSTFETGSQARCGIGSWIDYYNRRRPHSTFAGRTPDEVHAMAEMTEQLAA